ncbi:MAG: hypothetical protein SFZ02_11245 [bacterium]|nr:hypothetical protein [bacterium]
MRRHITIFALLVSILLLIGASIAQAKPAQVTLANAYFADQIPAGADIYVGIRTDDAYIGELDAVLGKITSGLSLLIPDMPATISLRQLLDQAVLSMRMDGTFDTTIRSWLGDSVGIGIYEGEQFIEHVLVIIDHTNRDAARTFIETVSGGVFDVTEEGAFTVYSSPNGGAIFIALNDDAIYMSSRRELIPFNGTPTDVLSNDPDFQKAVGALPSPNYNIVVAGDTGAIAQLGDTGNMGARSMLNAFLPDAYTALGLTIANGVSPTIDVAQVGLPADVVALLNTPIDPAFTQYIPANATGVIHGTNLIATYNTLIQLASANTGQDLQAQLDQAQAIFGFDVISLLLSGDFAMYFTYKPEGLTSLLNEQLEALNTNTTVSNPVDVTSFLEFGAIFEINDPTNAQSLIDQMFSMYGLLGGNSGVTASQEEIAGHTALVLTASSNSSAMSGFEIVIGANDTVLVMGTRESATAILTGNGGFDSNPFYQTSLRYTLPTMTHYWFLDRNIVSAGGAISQVLLGPAIGRVFTNITNNMAVSTPNPTEIARQEEEARLQNQLMLQSVITLNDNLQTFAQIFDNTTVSVSSKEGILFVRAVITLSE